ncbi:hypothetical protein GCM10010082_27580 [Kushneria pakistanensis]|uniref:Uncharacterized protein n=1 Tax=Kushneria pakistanensis TaxID=1508770 RepID=A0ABQ3FNJ1_9GAMM|nr:hypothetical protein GCM10010082_27580 [Kushneria pakistanensis]
MLKVGHGNHVANMCQSCDRTDRQGSKAAMLTKEVSQKGKAHGIMALLNGGQTQL